jgi:hypothetical protein
MRQQNTKYLATAANGGPCLLLSLLQTTQNQDEIAFFQQPASRPSHSN